jgi:hypothetical protein
MPKKGSGSGKSEVKRSLRRHRHGREDVDLEVIRYEYWIELAQVMPNGGIFVKAVLNLRIIEKEGLIEELSEYQLLIDDSVA